MIQISTCMYVYVCIIKRMLCIMYTDIYHRSRVHTYIHTYIQIYTYVYIHIYVYTHIYINYIYTFVYVYEHKCTMHICTPSLSLPPSLTVSLSRYLCPSLAFSPSLSRDTVHRTAVCLPSSILPLANVCLFRYDLYVRVRMSVVCVCVCLWVFVWGCVCVFVHVCVCVCSVTLCLSTYLSFAFV